MWAVAETSNHSAMEKYSLEALVYDPSKCSKLSVEKKRELIYEVSKRSDGVSEMLKAWSRQEILQVLCSELGEDMKTGLPKSKMIEQLLNIVKDKISQDSANILVFSENGERTLKRQKKFEPFKHLPVATSSPDIPNGTIFCKNSACQAFMSDGNKFCKRCTCCICHKFDDNKDPSLWLICNSDSPFHGASCGMSCHLECALKHENSGISHYRQDKRLDGMFYCTCGKVNDLLGSWRKQLVVARDTRKVDELCYRLSLGQKILAGTKHYKNLCKFVDEAVQKLEEELGPLTGLPKKARGIVNRLSSGPEVQKICASAVDYLDFMLSNFVLDTPSACYTLATKVVRFEDIRDSSLTVILNSDDSDFENVMGCRLWLRKFDTCYPEEPTGELNSANTKFLISALSPATQYFLRVVAFDTARDLWYYEFQFQTTCQNLNAPNQVAIFRSPSNPSSVEDESNEDINKRGNYNIPFYRPADETSPAIVFGVCLNSILDQGQKETSVDATNLRTENRPGSTQILLDHSEIQIQETGMDNGSNPHTATGLECVPYIDGSEPGLPISPAELENVKDSDGRNNDMKDIDYYKNYVLENAIGKKPLEHYVKAIRRLECDGHIETEFRTKFLTWFTLSATPRETRVAKVFIDTLSEDGECLAEQLVDAFGEAVSTKKSSTVPTGFCKKLWH